MIVTVAKPLGEILDALQGRRSVGIVGCALCATTCHTGGEREVADMATELRGHGLEVPWTVVLEGACHRLLGLRDVSRLQAPEAVLVMACGSGVQTLAAILSVPVLAALDSLFLGSIQRAGVFEERCSMCGSCRLNEFAGICPVTRCPKHLLNGPCGGMENGRCEVDGATECPWHLIWESKAADGRLGDLEAPVPPRSRRRGAGR